MRGAAPAGTTRQRSKDVPPAGSVAAAALLSLAGVVRGEPPRSAELSLAAGPVEVVAPPGRAGNLAPRWTSTTTIGADPPVFASTDERTDPSELFTRA